MTDAENDSSKDLEFQLLLKKWGITEEEFMSLSIDELKTFERNDAIEKIAVSKRKFAFSIVSALFFLLTSIVLYFAPYFYEYEYIFTLIIFVAFVFKSIYDYENHEINLMLQRYSEYFYEEIVDKQN